MANELHVACRARAAKEPNDEASKLIVEERQAKIALYKTLAEQAANQ